MNKKDTEQVDTKFTWWDDVKLKWLLFEPPIKLPIKPLSKRNPVLYYLEFANEYNEFGAIIGLSPDSDDKHGSWLHQLQQFEKRGDVNLDLIESENPDGENVIEVAQLSLTPQGMENLANAREKSFKGRLEVIAWSVGTALITSVGVNSCQ